MTRLLPLFLLAALPLHAGPPAPIPEPPPAAIEFPDETPAWSLTAGLQWRQIGQAHFRGGSLRGPYHLPAAPGTGGGLRKGYDDGFVRPDSAGGATTWNWGYNSASQVSGNTLTLSGRSTEVLTRTRFSQSNPDWSDDLQNAGVFLNLESPALASWGRFTLSAALGYSFARDDTARDRRAYRVERDRVERSRNVSDAYDISAIAPLPAAPYAGSFNGPGPVISLTPVRSSGGGVSERITGTEIFTGQLLQSLDLQVHTFSLGPRAGIDLGRLRLLAGLGFALNVMPWEAERRETLQRGGRALRSWQDRESGTELLPGLYAELGAQWSFSDRWFLFAGARYDWMDGFEGKAGGAAFEVNPGGWTALLGLGVRW